MKFLLFLLSLVSPFAFAADSSTAFTPPAGDLSVSMLASIFGVVDGVLHGTGSQILGTMFGFYNSAILTMGMVVLVYIFIVGTLNTAHDGEVMGKKWSSIWLPLRTVAGVALLLPKATGYSFIQIMVMWVVVQGVGAADTLWSKTLDYLGRGGVIVQPLTTFAQQGSRQNYNPELIPIAGTIFKSQVCMYALQNILNNQQQSSNTSQVIPFLVTTLSPKENGSAKNLIINFPGKVDIGDGVNYEGMCGSVSWVKADSIKENDYKGANADSRTLAVQQMILDLQPQAQQVANTLVPLKTNQSTTYAAIPLSSLLKTNTLFYSSVDYMAIMMPFLNGRGSAGDSEQGKLNAVIAESKKVGWIMAGAYYFDIAKISGNSVDQTKKEWNNPVASFPNLGSNSLLKSLSDQLSPGGCNDNARNALDKYCMDESKNNASANNNNSGSNSGSQANPDLPTTKDFFHSNQPKSPSVKKIANQMFGTLTQEVKRTMTGVNKVYQSMGDIYHAQTLGGNPIILVSTMGLLLVNCVETIFIGIVIAVTTATIVGGLLTIIGVGIPIILGVIAIMLWLIPLFMAILLPLLITGATLAYYVPMIPFILFLFGVMTWFASVIEAMIAAPLVALGLAHPDGHEHLGQAQYAVMLLANVFLRPLLMIFGFIAATILSSVMLWLVNYGFGKIWIEFKQDFLGVMYFVATMVVYLTLVLTIINRAFALIYEVPNKVLRWIGGSPEQTGEGAALEEAKAGISKGIETGGQAAGKVGEMFAEAAPRIAKAGFEAKEKMDEKKGSGPSSTIS